MKATTGERCPSCGKTGSKIIDTRMEKRVSEAPAGMPLLRCQMEHG